MGIFIEHFDDLAENLQIEPRQWLYIMHNYSILNWIHTILHMWGVNFAISEASTQKQKARPDYQA